MIAAIDAHVHVWTDDRKRYPRLPGERDYAPARFTPEDLFVHTRPAGVTRVVLIQMSFYRYDNSYMLDCMRKWPNVFSGVGIVDDSGADPGKAMEDLARRGVRGFRIVPVRSPQTWLDAPGMRAMWAMGAKKRLAMCPLVGPDALASIDRMCTKHPDTPVVIDHMARIGASGEIRESDVKLLCSLAQHANVKVKLSAFYALGRKRAPYSDLASLIRRLYDAFGPQRLMWASDSPFQVQDGHRYDASIALIREGLPFLSESDREWLLARTAASVFFNTSVRD
jgi:predicted TIM-barrel fold metal-dependent hydrolase